uniref:Uncharacterized protein n=1 Tax=Solanum tuberosum TaxID=4113 RepID=M1CPT9_SOLTU
MSIKNFFQEACHPLVLDFGVYTNADHKMVGDLFEDLPPLAAPPSSANGATVTTTETLPAPLLPLPPAPTPALKSALKTY